MARKSAVQLPKELSKKKKKPQGKLVKSDKDSKASLSKVTKSLLFEANCLSCKRYAKCTNKKKRYDYVCDDYKQLKVASVDKIEVKPEIIVRPKHILQPVYKLSEAKQSSDKFEKMVNDAYLEFSITQLPPDISIDDRDIPLAKNILEFCSKEFLNVDLFAKQLQIAIHTFAEYCPDCSDTKYVNDIPLHATTGDILEKVTLLEWGKCPKCKGNRAKFWKDGKLKVPFELAALCGQRSGKSSLAKIMLVYTYHRYLKLANPGVVFGLLPEDTLNSYLIGLTFAKAKTLLYDGIYNYLKNGPWFQNYHALLDDYGKRTGEEIYRVKDHFAAYRHRKMHIQPQGPDMRKLRGITAFAGGIDELGWFINSKGDNSQIKINGEEVYTSMGNAFTTVRSSYRRLMEAGRYDIPPPMFVNTSSPSSKKDMICNIYKRSKNSDDIYGIHASTWEMNPNVTRKDLQGKFNDNYAKALRDYGAVPPNSSMPYIEKMKQIKVLCLPNVHNNLSYRSSLVDLPSKVSKMSGKVIFRTKDKSTIPHILCFDAGIVNNSFAITTAYFDTKLNVPVFDGFIEVIPNADNAISFTAVYNDLIAPIIEHMNVKFVASDRWQNLKIFSDIESDFEIETASYSLKYAQFMQFKEDVDTTNMAFPMPEVKFNEIENMTGNDYPNVFLYKPVAHLISQMLTVQDVQKDVIKGQGLTDDIFRTVVLAHSYMTDPNYMDLFMGANNDIVKEARALIAYGGGGSGGVSSNSMGTVGSRRR